MDDSAGDAPRDAGADPVRGARPAAADRARALLEVIACSGFPTQIALQLAFAVLGYVPMAADGRLNFWYIVALQLLDAALLMTLAVVFIRAQGDSAREVFLGSRRAGAEAWAGVPLIAAALAIALAVLVTIQLAAPWLRDVPENPLKDLIRRPSDAAIFAVVVVIAGGVREEVQRGFLLNRFERWLGGGGAGIAVTSIAFGLGHRLQGADAAIATGILGAFWGIVYLRRRSIVAPVVSHAGFNLLQLAQFLVFGG